MGSLFRGIKSALFLLARFISNIGLRFSLVRGTIQVARWPGGHNGHYKSPPYKGVIHPCPVFGIFKIRCIPTRNLPLMKKNIIYLIVPLLQMFEKYQEDIGHLF